MCCSNALQVMICAVVHCRCVVNAKIACILYVNGSFCFSSPEWHCPAIKLTRCDGTHGTKMQEYVTYLYRIHCEGQHLMRLGVVYLEILIASVQVVFINNTLL